MSPEYAMEGLFSVKSDVYSFGVLLLEIISGKRNTSLRSSEHGSLIGYVSLPNQVVDRPSFSLSVNDQSSRYLFEFRFNRFILQPYFGSVRFLVYVA